MTTGYSSMPGGARCNVAVETTTTEIAGEPDEKRKAALIRSGEGGCKLPFFGKVVDSKAAPYLSRGSSLPLGLGIGYRGDAKLEQTFPLFLDAGGSAKTLETSNACVAFMVPMMPKPEPADGPGPSNQPPVKKAKTKEKPAAVATHKVVVI